MLSDEEKKALYMISLRRKGIPPNGGFIADNEEITIILNLIENQSKEIEEYKKQLDLDNECEIALNSKVMDLEKEIEELKEDKYGLEEEVQIQAKQLIEIDGNYISKEESEQKEKKAYIKGTNDAHELCNKKWEDKIKAKTIEIKNRQVKDEFITASQGKLNTIIDMESLLEKE